jgi:hypothetical protein
MIMHRRLKLVATVISILGTAGLAFARIDNMPEAPIPEGSSGMGMSILYSVVFVVAICVVGFKSCRRTQVD